MNSKSDKVSKGRGGRVVWGVGNTTASNGNEFMNNFANNLTVSCKTGELSYLHLFYKHDGNFTTASIMHSFLRM